MLSTVNPLLGCVYLRSKYHRFSTSNTTLTAASILENEKVMENHRFFFMTPQLSAFYTLSSCCQCNLWLPFDRKGGKNLGGSDFPEFPTDCGGGVLSPVPNGPLLLLSEVANYSTKTVDIDKATISKIIYSNKTVYIHLC